MLHRPRLLHAYDLAYLRTMQALTQRIATAMKFSADMCELNLQMYLKYTELERSGRTVRSVEHGNPWLLDETR